MCSVVGPTNPISNGRTGIQATCYARSVELANTIIFEAATDFIHILALGMAAIMVLHVRSKFTAVGERFRPEPIFHMRSDKWCSINRSQRNYHLLLHLHGFDHELTDIGRWSHTTGVRHLPLFRGRAKWLHFCSVHLPPYKWLCRVSAIRRWYKAVRVATSRLFDWDVCHLRRSVDLDIQRESWIRPDQHCWPLRGAVLDQRHMLVDLLGHADNPCHEYPARPLATRRHLFWSLLLRYWPGDSLRIQ